MRCISLNDPPGSPQKFKTYPKDMPDAKTKIPCSAIFLRPTAYYVVIDKSAPGILPRPDVLDRRCRAYITLATGVTRVPSTAVLPDHPGRPHTPPTRDYIQYRPSLGPSFPRQGHLALAGRSQIYQRPAALSTTCWKNIIGRKAFGRPGRLKTHLC